MELQRGRHFSREYFTSYKNKVPWIDLERRDRDFSKVLSDGDSDTKGLYSIIYGIAEIIVSLIGAFSGLVLFPLILFGNLLANPGKLLYTQERVGLKGEKFQILKFRTMRCISQTHNIKEEPTNTCRATAFGKFLRQSHLDEIPQFYNILKGEMRLIGPRPERPLVVKEFSKAMPGYDLRHHIKPGLTGWAQVKVGYNDSPRNEWEKLQYDLYYVKNKGLFLDVKILLRTFTAIFFLKGQ